MNTVNRSKCRVPTSTNCSGSTKKKASTRLRWSPRRVGESVMNSRSAKNATSANSTVAAVSPSTQPTQNTVAMAQEVCRSARRRRAWALRSLAASASSSGAPRRLRTKPQSVNSDSTPKTTRNSAPICWVVVRLRRKAFMASNLAEGHDGAARAVEERPTLLAGFQLEGRAERHRAQNGHRHHLALGDDALHVVDPGGHQHHVGEHLRQPEQARLEGLRVVAMAARALGEDDDRVAALQCAHQRRQRVGV